MVTLMLTHCALAQNIFFRIPVNLIPSPNVGFFPAGLFVVPEKLSHRHDALWHWDGHYGIELTAVDIRNKIGLILGGEGVGSRMLFLSILPLAEKHPPFFKPTKGKLL